MTLETVGRYEVLRVLVSSETAEVCAALDPGLARTVALKVIRPDCKEGARARQELVREAHALAKLHHPNVVTIYDVGVEEDEVFIAMELVAGRTLADWLAAAPRPWPAVRDVFLAAGRGLAAAHAAGVVHRDFGLEKVIVGEDRVVVVGFGSVGTPAAPDDQLAFAGAFLGATERKAPARVEAALRRALAPDARDRWPTLAALLDEVDREPAARRRRAALAMAAVAALAAGAAAFGLGRKAATPTACAGASALVAPLWDDATQSRTREALRRSGRSHADGTFAHVDASLRRRLAEWASAHDDACAATYVRHEQAAELLDARMACLARARGEIAALVSLLGDADAGTADRAVAAAVRVGDVGSCANLTVLRKAVRSPENPTEGRLYDALAHLTALRLLGKMPEGEAAGRQLVDSARAAGDAPLLAAALDVFGWFEMTSGHDDAAIALGYETARAAAEARDDSLVASGMSRVAYVLGVLEQRFEPSEVAFHVAVAAAERAGNPGPVLARLYGDRAQVLLRHGDYLTVVPLSQLAFAISVRAHGAASYQAALTLSELAGALHYVGHPRDADGLYRQALATAEEVLGPEHPWVLAILNNAGTNRLAAGDFDGAAPFFQREMLGMEKIFGPSNIDVAAAANNLGITRRGQRRLPEARALLERSIRIRVDNHKADHPGVAESYTELAEVDRLEGRPDDALADLDRALAVCKRAAATSYLVPAYRARATVLVGLGRLEDARADLALAEEAYTRSGADLVERALLWKVAADVVRAAHHPGEAIALYRKALPRLETQYGQNGPGLVDALLGLGEAFLDAGDGADAIATAERAVTIETYAPGSVDELGAASFLLARARWTHGDERPSAVSLARIARARLAALPYPTETLPRIDRWLAHR